MGIFHMRPIKLGSIYLEYYSSCPTCFSAKWNWHSFFHSCRSSLSMCSVGVACPRLMMSQASVNLYRMLFCMCSGRSLSVIPLETFCKDTFVWHHYFNTYKQTFFHQANVTFGICKLLSCCCQLRIVSNRQAQMLMLPTSTDLPTSRMRMQRVELRSCSNALISRGFWWSSRTGHWNKT